MARAHTPIAIGNSALPRHGNARRHFFAMEQALAMADAPPTQKKTRVGADAAGGAAAAATGSGGSGGSGVGGGGRGTAAAAKLPAAARAAAAVGCGAATGARRVVISRGAEAVIEELAFLGLPAILKTRVPKLYRLPQLEKMITRERTVGEVRCLRRCWGLGIRVPLVYCVNVPKGIIVMERVAGPTVKKHLLELCGPDDHPDIAQLVGRAVASLHNNNIVHGDLTTSNMLVEPTPAPAAAAAAAGVASGTPAGLTSRRLALIDFGLGNCNAPPQTKAVDLYVLERAFLSTHPEAKRMFEMVLEAYTLASKNPGPVIKRFKDVQARGRKREAFG